MSNQLVTNEEVNHGIVWHKISIHSMGVKVAISSNHLNHIIILSNLKEIYYSYE